MGYNFLFLVKTFKSLKHFNFYLATSSRIVLATIVSFQVALAPTLVYANNGKPPSNPDSQSNSQASKRNSNENQEIAKAIQEAYQNPKDRAQFNKIQDFADQIENGQIPTDNPEQFDIFKLAKQRVEILGHNGNLEELNLNDFKLATPVIAFSQTKVRYDESNKELIIEGIKGAHADGTGGVVVARHIFYDIDVKAFADDGKLLLLLDSQGKLHAIDREFYVLNNLFKERIPVFSKIWEPTYDIGEISKAKIDFITPGTPLYDQKDVDAKTVIPLDENRKPKKIKFGTALVQYQDPQGKTHVLGLFERDAIKNHMKMGATHLLQQIAFLRPNEDTLRYLEEAIKTIESTNIKPEELSDSFDNLTNRFLQQFTPEQLKSLSALAKAKDTHRFGSMSYEDLSKLITEVRERQTRATQDKEKELNEKIQKLENSWISKLAKPKIAGLKKDIEEMSHNPLYTEEGLKLNWMSYIPKQKGESPIDPTSLEKLSDIATKSFNIRNISVLLALGASAYVALPFVYDQVEALQQIQISNWMYENYLFPVLKDLTYRSTLIFSMISMIAIWPAAHLFSWGTQNFLKILGKAIPGSHYIRELAKNWTPLRNWQRLVSMGMRVYAQTVYPLVRRTAETVLRQKVMFEALQHSVNPFQKVLNPETNKKEFVGLNNPFLTPSEMKRTVQTKEKLMSAIAREQIQARDLAWVLAIQTVSQKEGVDPATLIQVSSGKIEASKISDLIHNPVLRREALLISYDIYKQLKSYDLNAPNINSVDMNLVQEFTDIAQNSAKKILSYSENRQKLVVLWNRFKSLPHWAFNSMPFIAGGMKEYKFLNSVYTDDFVSEQVFREFALDHVSMAVIYSLIGARADMTHPENLAADANGFLWTGKGNLYDMFSNTYAHFFVTGARMALVYQTVKPRISTEYFPLEDYQYLTQAREQGFLGGTLDWFKSVLNPLEADIAHFAIKSFFKRWATIQSGIIMTSFFQGILLHRNIPEALLAFGIAFFAGQWFYGWIWDPVQRGNQLTDQKFEFFNDLLKQARFDINQGLDEKDEAKSLEQIRKGTDKIIELYKKQNPRALKDLNRFLKNESPELLNKFLELRKELLAQEKPTGSNSAFNLNEDSKTETHSIDSKEAQRKAFSKQEEYYYGLLSELALAVKAKDEKRAEEARHLLSRLVSQDEGLDFNQIEKLSAKGLLEFSVSNPPIYTKPNSVLMWMTTLIAAAGSTIMATPYSVRITTNSYITFENLFFWVAVSIIGYSSIYFALGKTPWEFYIKKARALRERIKGVVSKRPSDKFQREDLAISPTKGDAESQERFSTALCAGLFR